MRKPTYTTPELAEVVNLPQRKFLSFVERGYVSPSVQDAAGHGSKRLWSNEDLIRAAVIAHLAGALSVPALRLVGEMIREPKRLDPGEILTIPMPPPGDDSIWAPYSKYEGVPVLERPATITVVIDSVRIWIDRRIATVI
jgi:hypothetical protein